VGRCGTRNGVLRCRAGKPNVLQRADQRNRQRFRGRLSCVTAWAVERVRGVRATDRALLAVVGYSPASVNIEQYPTLAHRTSYLTTTGASADRVFASATDQTDSFSQDTVRHQRCDQRARCVVVRTLLFPHMEGHTASFLFSTTPGNRHICSTRSQLLNLKYSTGCCTGMPTHWPRKEWSWSVYLATASHRSALQDFLEVVENASRPADDGRKPAVTLTPHNLTQRAAGTRKQAALHPKESTFSSM
jgi:hypothetical protein